MSAYKDKTPRERFVVTIGPQINIVSRYNDWCLNLIFGPRKDQ